MLRALDAVVWQEDDAKKVIYSGVVVDRLRDGVNELDDQLRHEIARGRFASEDEGARCHIGVSVALETQIESKNVESVEVLALVFVDALYLDIEERIGVYVHTGSLFHVPREVAFGREFHIA